MKKLFLLLIITFATISCNNDLSDNDYKEWENKIVFWAPDLIIKDTNNNNLFKNGVYKLDKLSLIATDENWNDLYKDGNRLSDREGIVQVLNVLLDNENNPVGVTLGFGYEYQKNNQFVISYYKFQYDDNKFDYIKTKVDITNNNYILTSLIYNGTEYIPSKIPATIIIKNE